MGRHEAPVPPRRRAFGAVLGVATIGVLAWLLSVVSVQPTWPFSDPQAAPTRSVVESTAGRPTTTIGSRLDSTSAPSTTSLPTTTSSSSPVASTTSTSSSPTSTTVEPTTTSTIPPLRLGPDGLGPVDLGEPTDEVMAVVAERLGPPSSDTGWISPTSDVGRCPGTAVRVVRWGSLRVYFSDGPTAYGEETSHLFYFNNSSAETDEIVDIPTPRGVGLGSSVADLEAAYGDAVTVESSITFGPTFVVDPAGPGILSGTLTVATDDGVITSIAGGFGCGS